MTLAYYAVVSVFVANFLLLTIWAIWPPSPLFLTLTGLACTAFAGLMAQERRAIRRLMHDAEVESEAPR
jgi:hypothetical protein